MSCRMRLGLLVAFSLIVLLAFNPAAQAADKVLKMATTTSTNDTGLLDYLAPMFQKDTGIELQWVAVGTGKALAHGRNCDVSVLLVHAPAAEKAFVDAGYGLDRTHVMYNDFVIAGPPSDSAGVKGKTVAEAMKAIEAKKTRFFSRGDKSGTHMKEQGLWKQAGLPVPDKQAWYASTGQGMMATMRMAAEQTGYTLVDRGTYIKYASTFKDNPPLVPLVEGDSTLFNPYAVMAVNPDKCPSATYDSAMAFIHWIVSAKAQKAIGDFRLLGKPLFIPDAK